jgi:predicted TPR repeat methyltransferase
MTEDRLSGTSRPRNRPGLYEKAVGLPDTGTTAKKLGLWKSEFPVFAGLLERNGEPVAALRQFGSICRRAKNDELAIEAFVAALGLAPGDAWLWRDLADVYQKVSRDDLAEICIRAALDLDAGHAGTWLQLAALADKQNNVVESEQAFRRALALDPGLADAWLGLGVLYLKTGRFEDAITCLRESVERNGADAIGYICLGQAYYSASQFRLSAEAFERAASFGPLEGHIGRRHARARTFSAMIEGDVEQALAAYPALAGPEAEPLDDIARDAFALFSAYDHMEAALAVGRLRLTWNPDDPVQAYLADAVAGKPITSVPPSYVEAHFDAFAAGFDQKLVDVLKYRVPHDLAERVAAHRSAFSRMLDLGCGTGLAAEPLARFGTNPVGVDLSAQMLAQAGRRRTYRALIKSEAIDFLGDHPGEFDLVFAADLIIYFGRLDALIAAVARAMVPGGVFAASIERMSEGDFRLLPSGRFAHSDRYFRSLAAPYFDILEQTDTMIRLEAGQPVPGGLFLLRRR